jgi:DNA repair protein RadC
MFICMSLDTKNQPTNIQVCSIGRLNVAIVHPREIYKNALLSNSASIVVAKIGKHYLERI